MKIIITEDQSLRLRRVYHIIEEFIGKINHENICQYWTRDEGQAYVNEIISDLMIVIESIYKDMTYEEIYDMLYAGGFYVDILETFYDVIDECDN